jgi:hypothetical protein
VIIDNYELFLQEKMSNQVIQCFCGVVRPRRFYFMFFFSGMFLFAHSTHWLVFFFIFFLIVVQGLYFGDCIDYKVTKDEAENTCNNNIRK